jgi:hypothetical protein
MCRGCIDGPSADILRSTLSGLCTALRLDERLVEVTEDAG